MAQTKISVSTGPWASLGPEWKNLKDMVKDQESVAVRMTKETTFFTFDNLEDAKRFTEELKK
jgi:hypothetical protein